MNDRNAGGTSYRPPEIPSRYERASNEPLVDAPTGADVRQTTEQEAQSLSNPPSLSDHQQNSSLRSPLGSVIDTAADPTAASGSVNTEKGDRMLETGGDEIASSVSMDSFRGSQTLPPSEAADISQGDDEENRTGGRLWRLACDQVALEEAGRTAAWDGQQPAGMRKGPGQRLAETLMERMRSRAEPDAVVEARPPRPRNHPATHTLVKVDAEDEEFQFLVHSGLAQKRVKVAQLLIIGIIGILVGWLGNSVVGTSCYFASVQVEVGEYGDLFSLHFGLYKYSTVDSSLNGYKYCYPYGGQHGKDAPVVARITNLLALLAGTYSLVVLWWYLIVGQFRATVWRWAVWLAVSAGLLQLSTLSFFGGRLCRNNDCAPGPASFLTLVTAAIWIALAWELHYNMPMGASSSDEADDMPPAERKFSKCPEQTMVAQLEMADFAGASQEYMERCQSPSRRQGYQPPELS